MDSDEIGKLAIRTCELVLAEDDQAKQEEACQNPPQQPIEEGQQNVAGNDPVKADSAEKETTNTETVWSGEIICRNFIYPRYSTKVFLEGIATSSTCGDIRNQFSDFGNFKYKWARTSPEVHDFGSLFLEFQTDEIAKKFVDSCTHKIYQGMNFYYRSCPILNPNLMVRVVPAVIQNNVYPPGVPTIDPERTVFVSPLNDNVHAQTLAKIFGELFGPVRTTSLLTDSHKYPTGYATVTFHNLQSFRTAVLTESVLLKTRQFTMKIQIMPYLIEDICAICKFRDSVMYCKAENCFAYYCEECWVSFHLEDDRASHKPLIRKGETNNDEEGTAFVPVGHPL